MNKCYSDILLKRISCVNWVVHELGKRVFQIAAIYFIGNMFLDDCTTVLGRDLTLRKPVQILTLSLKESSCFGTIRSNIKFGLQILVRYLYRLT